MSLCILNAIHSFGKLMISSCNVILECSAFFTGLGTFPKNVPNMLKNSTS